MGIFKLFNKKTLTNRQSKKNIDYSTIPTPEELTAMVKFGKPDDDLIELTILEIKEVYDLWGDDKNSDAFKRGINNSLKWFVDGVYQKYTGAAEELSKKGKIEESIFLIEKLIEIDWATEKPSIIERQCINFRKIKDYESEVFLIKRYLDGSPAGYGVRFNKTDALLRLDKAQELLDRHGNCPMYSPNWKLNVINSLINHYGILTIDDLSESERRWIESPKPED